MKPKPLQKSTYQNSLLSGIGTRDKPGDFIFHNGGGPGINTWMQSDVATGYSIIVLGNYSPPTASKVVRYIGKTLNLDVL